MCSSTHVLATCTPQGAECRQRLLWLGTEAASTSWKSSSIRLMVDASNRSVL